MKFLLAALIFYVIYTTGIPNMNIQDWFLHQEINGTLAILLYWLPLVLCTYGYAVRTGYDIAKDKRECHKQYYTPELRIGTLIGRGIAAIVPVVNLLCAIFDVAPEVFSRFFTWIGEVFNQPIVSKKYVEPPKE